MSILSKNSTFYSLLNSKRIQFSGVLFFLLPIFLINITDYQDWGGDFAQYIQQGVNIVNGEAQSSSNYIFNPSNNYLAPPSYPSGFPFLLSFVIFFFGSSIFVLKVYVTALLIASSLLVFKFLNHYFSFKIAFIATFVFAYNPWLINFKQDIISDIPFLLFFLAGILSYIKFKTSKRKILSAILIGLFIGYSMLIKNIGIILLPAILIDLFLQFYRSKEKNKRSFFIAQLKSYAIITTSCFGVYFLINNLLFPEKTELYGFFLTLFDFNNLGDIWLRSAQHYIETFEAFFYPDTQQFHFVPLIYKSFALTFLVIGFFQKVIKSIGFLELTFVAYLIIIFSFPIYSQGFRYLLPILPIIFYYIIYGLKSIQFEKKINPNYYFVAILFITLFLYKTEITSIANRKHVAGGPFSIEAKQTFKYIQDETTENSIFVFNKPRVLGLYGKRKSFANNPKSDLISTEKQLDSFDWDYILKTSELRNHAIDSFLIVHKNELDLVYSNGSFELFHLIE